MGDNRNYAYEAKLESESLKKSKSKKSSKSVSTTSGTSVRKVDYGERKGIYIPEKSKLLIEKETKESRDKQRGIVLFLKLLRYLLASY